MADGHFGLSRPVRNSFAIVRADKSAGAYQLAVEPRTGFGATETSYSTYSGALGPAVVPSLPPYFDRILQVDAPDAPAGTSLGGQVFILNPGNKSGFVLTVGGAGNVSVVGNMVDRDGDPLAYISGQAKMVGDDPEAKPITFFTNARGRFVLDGVEAGKSYTLNLETNDQPARQSLAIPDELVGTYRLEGYVYFDLDVPAPDDTKPQPRKENDNGEQTEN
jgi:outer membrane usher protein